MMREKLTETERACRLIRSKRRYDRTHHGTKCVSISLFKEGKSKVSAVLMLKFNISTDNVSFSNALGYKRKLIYPSVFGKLSCHTERGLEYLERQHELVREYDKEHKEDLNVRSSTYYEEHKEELLAKAKIFYQKHKEEMVAKARKYREKKKEDKAECVTKEKRKM